MFDNVYMVQHIQYTYSFLSSPPRHGLINYKDTKTKCLHLKNWPITGPLRQVFIRVYRLEIQSVMLVFSTHLCELLALQPSLWFNSPPPHLPFVIVCTVCGWEDPVRVIFCRSSTLCIWPDRGLTKLLDHSKQKPSVDKTKLGFDYKESAV